MKKIISLILFSFLFLMNCNDINMTAPEEESVLKENPCVINNVSEACMLKLTNIEFSLPEESCSTQDIVVELKSEFKAPAGIGDGTTTRIDWEFFPNGNAGFWIEPVHDNLNTSSGIIQVDGCFSYGSQDTLRITQTIIDEYGNESNPLMTNIPRSTAKQKLLGRTDDFMVIR